MLDPKKVIRRVLQEIGERELSRVRRTIGSRTLRAAIRLIINESEERADLFIPHYWAVYYHDGRPGFSAVGVGARKLVFFDNPADDPRKPTPERENQVKHLTRDQYQEGLRRNAERAARGARPFMYVVDSVGAAPPRPFFTQLEVGAARRADEVVLRTFERELLDAIDRDPATRSETRIADIGFGL
jgi:hypothetical protein